MDAKELNMNELAEAAGGTGEDARYYIHTVKKGETLHKIALHYGVKVEEIMEWNNIADRNLIFAGQDLKIYQEIN